jgi:hypothetical protein
MLCGLVDQTQTAHACRHHGMLGVLFGCVRSAGVLVVWCRSNVTTVVQLGSCVLGLALARLDVPCLGGRECYLLRSVGYADSVSAAFASARPGGGKVCSTVQYSVKGNSVLLGGQQ